MAARSSVSLSLSWPRMHERACNCMLNAWNAKWAGPGTWIDCIPNRTHIDSKSSINY